MEDELLALWSSHVGLGRLRDPRPGGGDRPGRPGLRAHRRAGDGQGHLPSTCRGPRNVAEIRFEPRFIQLYEEIWDDLRDEVLVSYERAKQRGLSGLSRDRPSPPEEPVRARQSPAAAAQPPDRLRARGLRSRRHRRRLGAGDAHWAGSTPSSSGQPSGIWAADLDLDHQGTALGPLWEQIAVTMEETVLGFLIGVVLGVIFGIALGRNRLLADVLGPYIKAANSIPRVVLGSIFVIWLGLGM